MGFASAIHPAELIIHDETPGWHHVPPPGQSTGLNLAMKPAEGYGAAAGRFPTSLLVPRSEWQDRIKELEDTKSNISAIVLANGLPCKDQNGSNYCWINAPTHGLEVNRVLQNEPTVILSPASAGAQIKRYQNVGGWGGEAVRWISDNGLVPADRWPANEISPRCATADNLAVAKKYRATDWWELDVSDSGLDQLVSCLLHRIPVAVGYSWWGHEVLACDAAWLNGTVAIRIRNSWGMTWGNAGFGILQGRKMYPDDAVAMPVSSAAS